MEVSKATMQTEYHWCWRIGSLAAPILFVIGSMDCFQIQRIHHVHQKPRQMLFRQPVMQRWR
jgi:hypothetical protein